MNILLRELKANRKSTIIWAVSLSLYNFVMMSLFPSFADNSIEMEQFINQLPENFLRLFDLDKINITHILGYYAVEIYLVIILFGSIFAVLLSSGILSKEENEKTIEFLLSKPVNRNQIITGKFLCFLIYILMLNVIVSIITFAAFEIYKTESYSIKIFLMLSAAPFLTHITLANAGMLISLFIVKRKAVYSVSIGLVLGMYFLSMLAGLSENLEFIGYLTPFEYTNAANIIINDSIKGVYLIILACVNVFTVGLTYIIYNRKDIVV